MYAFSFFKVLKESIYETVSNLYFLFGSIYETVSNLYFLFERIYTCLLGYLFLYSKGGGGTEPLVYPCDTKVNILLLRAFIISVMLLSVVQT